MSLRMRYDHEDDMLMIWLAEGKTVDHADQIDQAILHVTESGEPVLLEILRAQEFVVDLVRTAISVPGQETITDSQGGRQPENRTSTIC